MENPPGASWGKIDLIFVIHAIFYYCEQFTRPIFSLILMQLVFFTSFFFMPVYNSNETEH